MRFANKRQRLDMAGGAFRRDGSGGGGGNPKGFFASESAVLAGDIQQQLSRASGQIASNGRGQPISMQAKINTQVSFDYNLYEDRCRTRPDDCIVDVGPRSAFTVQPGSYLFTLADRQSSRVSNNIAPSARDLSKGIAGLGEVEVFDCVNGLSYQKKLRFVGMMVTFYDGTDVKAEVVHTAQIHGTWTGINTGPVTLVAGKRAGFLATPFTVVDNGVLKPAIREKGVDPAKFRPMTINLDQLSGPELPIRAINIASTIGSRAAGITTQDVLLAKWRDARVELRKVVIDTNLDEETAGVMAQDYMPVDYYLMWQLYEAGGRNDAVFDYVEQAHVSAMSRQTLSDLLPEETPKKVGDFGSPEARRVHTEVRKAQCLANQEGWVEEHHMGRWLTTSPPGAPVDIFIRGA